MLIGYEPYLGIVNLYIHVNFAVISILFKFFCMNIYKSDQLAVFLCFVKVWCWWCQGFTKWLVMCFSFLCVLEQFKWFGIIYSLRGHWIHLWKSQAISEPFGGGQWEPLGLDSLEAESETGIHVKEFLRKCPQEKWRGKWEESKQGCGVSWPGASAWSCGEAWGKNSITEVAFLRLDVQCELLSHIWLFVTPRTVAHQAPLSMKFSRPEY